MDSATADTSAADTSVADTRLPDTTTPDTRTTDTTATDTHVDDTFVADGFVPDTYVADTFVPDTFVADKFVPDIARYRCECALDHAVRVIRIAESRWLAEHRSSRSSRFAPTAVAARGRGVRDAHPRRFPTRVVPMSTIVGHST